MSLSISNKNMSKKKRCSNVFYESPTKRTESSTIFIDTIKKLISAQYFMDKTKLQIMNDPRNSVNAVP